MSSQLATYNKLQASARYVMAWTAAPADFDIRASDPGKGAATNGDYCRAIMVATAGNLVVVRPDGTSVTVPFAAGQTLELQAKNLTAAGSTATNVLVMW